MAFNRLGCYTRGERTTNEELDVNNSLDSSVLIFFDTNFLLAISQLSNFNVSYELDRVIPRKRRLIVINPIYEELLKLRRKGNPKIKLESRIAINFADKFCERWHSEYSHRNIDFILLYYSEKNKGIIATNDSELKRLARNKNIKVLYIRNKRFLELQ